MCTLLEKKTSVRVFGLNKLFLKGFLRLDLQPVQLIWQNNPPAFTTICGLEASFPGPIAIFLLRSRNIIDMQIRMQKCETYVKRPKSEPPIKWVSSRNISSGYYNRDYPVDLSIVVRLRGFPTFRFKKTIWCYKLQPTAVCILLVVESARVAHAKKMIDSLIHY